ncbi:MAG TPA: hypothetical protein VEI46_06285, partial [Thermodesulfovibrionales bacterium]|nr:hypothetical protein [Thermodesulfovibrionales bacterium]
MLPLPPVADAVTVYVWRLALHCDESAPPFIPPHVHCHPVPVAVKPFTWLPEFAHRPELADDKVVKVPLLPQTPVIAADVAEQLTVFGGFELLMQVFPVPQFTSAVHVVAGALEHILADVDVVPVHVHVQPVVVVVTD